jgi:hypothetical protein
MIEHIIDLKHLSEQENKEVVLDVLYEHACELHMDCLITAIENYWENKERSAKGKLKND